MTDDSRKRRGWPPHSDMESADLQRKLRRLYGDVVRDPVPDHLRALAEELEKAIRKREEEAEKARNYAPSEPSTEPHEEDGQSNGTGGAKGASTPKSEY